MLNSIKDLYKFYIYHPSNGLVEVFPHNSTLEWTWEKNKEKSQAFRRKTLSTELNFKKQDFTLLHDLERSNYKCEKIIIEVHRKCSGGFSLFWVGYLALIDGDYDLDKCIVSIKPRLEDEYSCILSNWTKEKDFIGGVGAPPSVGDIRITIGEIETTTCTSHPYFITSNYLPNADDYPMTTFCLDNIPTWTFVGNTLVNLSIFNETEYEFEVESKFIRERAETFNVGGVPDPPSGLGWVLISNNGTKSVWVRPISAEYDQLNVTPIGNGRRLTDVIQYLIQDCGLDFVSDFFNKNPDNTSPDNFAYDYAELFYKELIIWQKSDVKRQPRTITDSNNNTITLSYVFASKAIIKLKDLLNWLNIMYNVQWKIIGNKFRIEHYTYWNSEKQNLIDLTDNSRIKGLYRYKYEVEELPASETWQWMEETDKSDFDGLPIFYSETCSYGDDDGKDLEYSVSKITTNVDYIINNPSKISDDGFVIASTGELQNKLFLLSAPGSISGENKINASNSFANLLYYLHRHVRPQRSGNMNGSDTSFYYPVPSRSQNEITFALCCEELENFDTNMRIRTQLGWGDLDTVKFKDPSSLITVKLLYE